MSIKAKDALTLDIEDAEALIRSASSLYFSRQRARWLATHGAELAAQVNEEIRAKGASEITMERVIKMIEAKDDSCD